MKLWRLIVALVFFPFVSHADNLFDWDSQANKHANTANAFSKKHSFLGKGFSIKSSAIRKLKLKDAITINLFETQSYIAKVTEIKTSRSGTQHIIAKIVNNKESLPVIITIGSTQFFIRIVTPDGVMVGQGKNDRGFLLKESLLEPLRINEEDDFKLQPIKQEDETDKYPTQPFNNKARTNKSASNHGKLLTKAMQSNALSTVDVLFVYSLTAEALYDGDITTRLDHIIAVTNQIYVDSGVEMQINIVNTLAVDYADEAVADTALDDITFAQDDVFKDIESIRFESGADMVVLLRPFIEGDSACGLAWANPSITSSAGYMYSHVSVDCSDYVTAHELGHNMGLAHSRAQGDVGYTFPYAIGHRVQDEINGFSTVMAYSVQNADKVYKFSNPEIECTELPCGIDRQDPVNGADARYALNQVRFQLEELMDKEPDLTLASDALDSIIDSNLRSCVSNQISTNTITYASQLRSIYCSYRDISNLTGLDSFKGLGTVYLSGNNINDITVLGNLSKLSTLGLSSNNISNLTPLSKLVNVQFLYLDDNKINDLSALENLTFLQVLWLSDNSFSDLFPIRNMTNITQLSIANNSISDVTPLTQLSLLDTLYAYQNNITNLAPLTELEQLKTLDLGSNEITDLTPITNLKNLEYLSVYSNQLSTFGNVINLSSLITLDLSYNQISQMSNLASLINLDDLRLDTNNLNSVSTIASAPKITRLDLTNNNLTDISPLSQLTQLKKLEIDNNPVSDISGLGDNESLEELNIDGTNINNFSAVSQFTSLERLSANFTSISDISPVSKLYNLFSIELESTRITNISPLFTLHNNWNTLKFSQSNNIYCWQLEYIRQFMIYDTFNSPSSCSSDNDSNDEDQDGISNISEVNSGTNPLYHNEEAGVLQFQFTDLHIEEDNSSITLKVVRENGNLGNVSVEVSANSGSATKNVDFSFTSQTLTFSDQELVKEITLNIIDDNYFDNDETFTIELSEPVSASLGDNSILNVTITDQDAVAFGWSSNYAEVSEADGSIFVTIERPQGASGDMSVDVSALDYQAINGTDFEFTTQTVSFSNESSKTIEVDIIDNDTFETNKGFYLTLSNPINAIINEDFETLLINILEDEVAPAGSLSFESRTYSISESGGALDVIITRSNGSFGTLNANIEVISGSATQGNDFSFENQSISFVDGELEKTITIDIIDDTTDESDETFDITLSSADSGSIGDIATTTVTINDNDEPAVVTPPVQNNSSSSGGGGSIQFLLLVMLLNLVWYRSRYYNI